MSIPPKTRARTKILVMVMAAAVVVAVCWVAGCAKKSEREAVPEIPDTLTVISDTLFKTHDTLSVTRGTLTDKRDGKTYKTVTIGKWTWMAENLNYETSSGSWCYDNDTSNCNKYGRLYTWNTAMTVCPSGWHLPTKKEWEILDESVGGYSVSGRKLKSKKGWKNYEGERDNGTDSYGFSALPGGGMGFDGVSFYGAGSDGEWWTATEGGVAGAYVYRLEKEYGMEHGKKRIGRSARCLLGAAASVNAPYIAASEDDQKSTIAKLVKRIPAGYRLFDKLFGDLNGDGADDCVLIIKATDNENLARRDEDDPESDTLDLNRRGIMIFLSNGNDYRLALENRECFESEKGDGGGYFAPELDFEIKKGHLYIGYEHGRYGWWKYTFRYKNSDFELIGYDDSDVYDRKITSVNFLSKKRLVKVCGNFREEGECGDCCLSGYKETWSNITAEETITLRKIEDISKVLKSGGDDKANIKIKMVFVKGGTFMMGCTGEQGSDCYSNEKPAHSVTISDFYIGKYEVTQNLWAQVMGSSNNRSNFKGGNLPVEMVSWDDVQQFILRLNTMTGKKYRLPTEAEWEYAARGGARSKGYKYSGSNNVDNVAWYNVNSGNKVVRDGLFEEYSNKDDFDGYREVLSSNKNRTRAVGTKAPNELGIYDMSGNVWEWVSDWYGRDYYSSSPSTNPKGPSSGYSRVVRGGGWGGGAWFCRVSYRDGNYPGDGGFSIGFRLVGYPT